jgi:hypothetical protein
VQHLHLGHWDSKLHQARSLQILQTNRSLHVPPVLRQASLARSDESQPGEHSSPADDGRPNDQQTAAPRDRSSQPASSPYDESSGREPSPPADLTEREQKQQQQMDDMAKQLKDTQDQLATQRKEQPAATSLNITGQQSGASAATTDSQQPMSSTPDDSGAQPAAEPAPITVAPVDRETQELLNNLIPSCQPQNGEPRRREDHGRCCTCGRSFR